MTDNPLLDPAGNYAAIIDESAPREPTGNETRRIMNWDDVLDLVISLSQLESYFVNDHGIVDPTAFPVDDTMTTILRKLGDLLDGFAHLKESGYYNREINLLVQEPERPTVARMVVIEETSFMRINELFPYAGDNDGVDSMVAIVDELLGILGIELIDPTDALGVSPYDVICWKLQHLHFAYALALVSSATSHVGEFDLEIYNARAQCFKVSDKLTFCRREMGSIGRRYGPFWILANKNAPFATAPDFSSDSGSDSTYLGSNDGSTITLETANKGTKQANDDSEEVEEVVEETVQPKYTFSLSTTLIQLGTTWAPCQFIPIDAEPPLLLNEPTNVKVIILNHGVIFRKPVVAQGENENAIVFNASAKEHETRCMWYAAEIRELSDGEVIFRFEAGQQLPTRDQVPWMLEQSFTLDDRLLIE